MGLEGLPDRFQPKLAKVIKTPWTLATGEDVRYKGAEGARPTRVEHFMQSYVDRVMAASTFDIPSRLALIQVFTMVAEPQALFRPHVLWTSLTTPRDGVQLGSSRPVHAAI